MKHATVHQRSCRRRFGALLLAILLLGACAPVEGPEERPWLVAEEDDATSEAVEVLDEDVAEAPEELDEPDEPPRRPEDGTQLPEADFTMDCPEFQSQESSEFDFDLYRYLACRRAPDQSLVFSPALVRIALAEAAATIPEDQATEVAQLLGKERLSDLVNYAELLREELLTRQPISTSSYLHSIGRCTYEILENDPEVLQRALGVEFYSSTCDGTCWWTPQNQRWPDQTFHARPPTPEVVDNQTRSIIIRAQTETDLGSWPGRAPFTTATGEEMPYPIRGNRLHFWTQTDLGYVADWRPLGGQLAFLLVRPHEDVRLETIEELLSRELLSSWVEDTRTPRFTLVNTFPAFDIEERVELGPIVGDSRIQTTTRIAVGAEGVNRPAAVELDLEVIPPELTSPATPLPHYASRSNPFLFIIYDRELEEILVMGRVARPY